MTVAIVFVPLEIVPRKGGRNYAKMPEVEKWDRRVIQFFSNVQFSDGCWNWTASCQADGYGAFSIAGKRFGAHRFSYEYFHGEIPNDMCVLHHCDVPKCVNPKHLWLGTKRDNLVDCYEKGRANPPRGERHYMAKLTSTQVLEIRKLSLSKTISMRGIAKLYKVSNTTVQQVVHRKTWNNLL